MMWQTLKKTGMAHLFTATYEHTPIAAWILFTWNDTVYYPYGASSRQHREAMAPTLLLWETARWAKSHGYKAYDLWGAMGPNPDQADPWYGFHRFKEGFAPHLTEFIGSYDLVIQPLPYWIYTLVDTVRWRYLTLRKKL
jgi:lipid II:glycine glycyltransferase (peptidoglycan interpeptide bridge formation enzyme)